MGDSRFIAGNYTAFPREGNARRMVFSFGRKGLLRCVAASNATSFVRRTARGRPAIGAGGATRGPGLPVRAGFRGGPGGATLAAADAPTTMRLARLLCFLAAVSTAPAGGAAAPAAALPIFDAHLHYNDEAAGTYPVADVLQRFRASGVRTILATSRPNHGTRLLAAAAAARPLEAPRVVPFIRPYRTHGDRETWFRDPAIYALIEDELTHDIGWRGIGEFHVFGRDADTPQVKRIVELAAARGLWLHAHCDQAALDYLLAHDPQVKIIWAHAGFTVPPGELAAYLARHPNVVAELSYRDDVTVGGKLAPAWRALFLAHADRFLLGSDTWVNERWARYAEIMATYRAWLAQLPPEVALKIASGNGERLFPPPAPAPDVRGLLFRIDKAGVPPSYVYGTLHSDDPRVTALPDPVAHAFGEARTFATEGRLTDEELAGFFAAAQFDDGRSLADYFDAATIARIREALGSGAPPAAMLDRMKPWAAMLLLAEKPGQGGGRETLDGVLLADARRRKLAILGLELADEQVASFDAVALPAQVTLVKFVLANRDALGRDHEAVIRAWLQRDLAALAALNLAPGRFDPEVAAALVELTRNIVDNRSVQMAHRLFIPLREGRVFVAVGALHLYGAGSLLALLREQGYGVRRVF
jgi:uncharacterized protein YbaP (TraB family)